ncbi:27434_t:CDS:2, partial [Dentiscutata erythropus]
IWSLQDIGPTEDINSSVNESETQKEYMDVVISEIISGGHFYIQIVNDNIRSLEKMMSEFELYHKTTKDLEVTNPKTGQIVSAQFTDDDQWYRAKIKKIMNEKKSAEVIYIDHGNSEIIPLSRIRPIPDNFKQLPSQSQEAVLSFIKVPERE